MLLKAGHLRHKPLSLVLVFLISLVFTREVKATAIYSPGETLNPSCLPTNLDCTVTPPMVASIGTTLSNQTISGSLNTILDIGNSSLVNPGLTITAGNGLSGGGLVNLGDSISLSLANIGTSGTYGGALNIPVLTVDAQGRITNVTPTTIAGLGTSNFSSANVSQWTNNSGYITSSVGTTLTNKTIDGNNNNILHIGNSSLEHPQVTVVAGVGLSGGGTVYLGETVTLKLLNVGTSGTYGSALEIPVLTTDAQGRIINVTNTGISGLTATNFTVGDFSSAINSGTYSIDISGTSSLAEKFSGILVGDVTGVQGSTAVNKINGNWLGDTTATAGNLLIGDSSTWVSQPMSGDATINSLGGVTLNYAAGQSADGTHKGFLTAADWLTFNGKQDVLGYTSENITNKSIETTLSVGGTASDILYPSQKAVKTYIDNLSTGLNWVDSLEFIVVIANTTAPVLTPADRDTYFIETGGNTGPWATFSAGDAVQYQTDHWVKIKSLAVGDGFGIGYQSPTTPYGAMTGKSNYLGIVSGGTPGAFTYSFTAPSNNDAVFVKDSGVYFSNMAFTYSSNFGRWMQFSATPDLTFDNGLTLNGKSVRLGVLTSDWNQTGVFNINTAGDINVEGGDIGTTKATASLFNTGATTLNIGGAASMINIGASGGTTLESNGALTINSYDGTTLTIDSATTGSVNLGTGNYAKVISIGNTNASTTLSINGGVLWSINNTGDLTTAGDISTTSTGTMTSAGLLTANNGLTVLSGGVSLPAGSIVNNVLVNSSLTVTAGVGMSGGGTVSLGGTTALAINLTTSGAIGTTASNSGLEVSASGLTLLKGCSDGQILKYTDADGWACQEDLSSGIRTLNGVTAAVGANTIDSGDYEQRWNWSMTSASKTAITIGESTPSTNGTGSQYLFGVSTVAGSTAAPLKVSAQGNIILDTTSAGGLTFGSTTANSTITMQSGTGTINIGTDANAKTISIGTTTGAATLNLISGTGGINIGTGTINKNINIGTGGANNVISIGTTSGTSNLNLLAGSGGINIGTGAVAKTISIGTGAAANTLVIGSTNTTSTTTIQSGSGNITFVVDGTNSSGKVVIGNSGTTAPDLLVLDNGTTDPTGTNGATYYNSSTNKFRCYENSTWKNCDTTSSGSATQSIGSTFATVLLDTGSSLVGTFTVTPTTNTADIYIYADFNTLSVSNTGQTLTAEIRSGTDCSGSILDSNYAVMKQNSGNDGPALFVATLVSNPGASAHNYAFCAKTTTAGRARVRGLARALVIDTGADLAEIYNSQDESLEVGDVVSLDSDLKTGMKKSQKAYDQSVLGIVSAKPGLLIGDVDNEGVKALPVALSGRVLVKVNVESGDIKAGDPLTTSSTPGVAMKATKAGTIIGTAMSDFEGDETGQVLMFIKNGSGNGTKIADLLPGVNENAKDFTNQILTQLMWQKNNLALTDLSEIITDRLVAGVEIITPKIVTDKTQTKNLCVGEENNETCITKSQLDQILSKMNIEIGTTPPTIIPTPTGIGPTLNTVILTE